MTDDRISNLNEYKNNNSDTKSASEQIDCGLPPAGNGSGTDPNTSESPQSSNSIPASILGRCLIFMGRDGHAYLGIVDQGNFRAYRIGSKPANRLIRQIAIEAGGRIKLSELKAINEELTEHAELSGIVREVFHRVAHTEDGIELDVGDDRHTRIRIKPGKVELITEGSETFFYRTSSMRPFVLPADRGDIRLLDNYLNLHPTNIVLLIAYISYTLAHPKIPTTNFVILVLQGDQGSGKSLLCWIIQILIDPSIIGVQTFPHNAKDLAIAAENAHVLMYDNMRRITPAMADRLCIASTGGALATRRLYTDGEQHVLWLHVALVLNGIHDFIDQPDLAQRCLHLHLRTLDETNRRSEAAFLQAFQADLPRIFRGLLDLIAQIMTHLPSVEVTNPERMIDFVRWLGAMEKVYGAPAGVFQTQYSSALNEGMLESLQENPLATVVMAFAEDLHDGQWTGTPTELLQALNMRSGGSSRDWPQNPIAMSKRLKLLQAALQRQGIDVQLVRGRERRVTITKMEGNH